LKIYGLSLSPKAPSVCSANLLVQRQVFFREIQPGYKYTWHTVVCREYVVTIDGRAEIEAGSGEKRRFGKGDVLLAEDMSGGGHRTRALGKKPWRQIFITLP
jgi:mannose-6-phosphate isomerase-like protein (cupin superfamily)